jgi:quinol-cytochrome oxidoreductase complex cytochrome b subunit
MLVQGPGAAPRDRSWARVAGFVFVVLGLAGVAVAGTPGLGTDSDSAFFLLFYLHLGVSLYDGRFGRWRTVTWVLLIAVAAGLQLAGFLAYVLPWGQVQFWLASTLAQLPLIGPMLQRDDPSLPAVLVALGRVLPFAVLALDLAALFGEMRREWPPGRWLLFLLIGVIACLGLGLALQAMIPPPSADPLLAGDMGMLAPILPPWHALPFYAVLRAVPSKPGGVIATLVLLWLPILWPWMRADALRLGPARWPWRCLCIALAAAWIGLGFLGARPPEPFEIQAAQGLTAAVFAFFLLVPPVLHRMRGRGP